MAQQSTFFATHPLYTMALPDWEFMDASYRGQDAIKDLDVDVLPATQAMTKLGMLSGQDGRAMYDAYKMRALYPEVVREATENLLGMLWTKPPNIELPTSLEFMRETATLQNESLEQVLLRIHEAQLTTGRIGALLDLAVDEDTNTAQPYIALYSAANILNWDKGRRDDVNPLERLKMVMLDETEYERVAELGWRYRRKFRILSLDNPHDLTVETGTYMVAVSGAENTSASIPDFSEFIIPQIRGQSLDEIPFVFINAKDIRTEPGAPPLKALANIAVAIYRGDADYRQNLFMQSQDTLVIIGRTSDGGDPLRLGAGATIDVPMGGDAKYVGVGPDGLGGQRQALEDDKKTASALTGQLADSMSRQKESAAALDMRIGTKTASLTQIANTSAKALENLIKIAAEWMGANPDEVVVEPNLEFGPTQMAPDDLLKLQTAKNQGAPISKETIHNVMVQTGLTEMSFEDEMDEIASEVPTGVTAQPGAAGGLDTIGGGADTIGAGTSQQDANANDTSPAGF